MTEQTKMVLKEVNAALGTKYDLIKFDALDDKRRLQLLADLLAHFGAGDKMDVAEEDAEKVSLQLLEMLGNVKYRPPASADPHAFRAQLLRGDAELVLAILAWLLADQQQVRDTAYLARYLKLPEVPAEMASAGGVAELLQGYRQLVDEFKEVHRRTRTLAAGDESGAEIVNDIKEMAVERDIVIKRLENVQVNLIDVNEKDELLSVSRNLRLQQERAGELANQQESQQNQLKAIGDQLKRCLNVLYGQSAAPRSAADVIKHLREEIQLNEYLEKEKLPAELGALRREVTAARRVLAAPAPARADLARLQDEIGAVHAETEALTAERLATRAPADDKLAPFRQQAALLRRNRDAAAARAHELAAALRDREASLAALNAQVRQLLGEAVLRGDELKQYVAALRHKSVVYKRQRATLSSYKVEGGVLTRTLHVVCGADPTAEPALLEHSKLRVDEPAPEDTVGAHSFDLAKRSVHELSQMVAQASQQVAEVRREVAPLTERLRPARDHHRRVQQQHEQRKRTHDAAAINLASQLEPLRAQAAALRDALRAGEEEWAGLRRQVGRAEELQEAAAAELRGAVQSPRRPSRAEGLQRKVSEAEAAIASLEERQQALMSRAGAVELQSGHWSRALQLLECKLACARHRAAAARAQRSHLTITTKSQMLTLQ